MTAEEYYGELLPVLKQGEQQLIHLIHGYPAENDSDGIQSIIYIKSRIKSPDSMIQKLRKKGLEATDSRTALENTNDAIGIRVVCSFCEEVYKLKEWLCERREIQVIKVKDYMAYPKPNGYRSIHLIVQFQDEMGKQQNAEIQIRTIAIDFWAVLEHQMKYKKHVAHEEIIRNELKRCADEIASLDVSMQTIREILGSDDWGEE